MKFSQGTWVELSPNSPLGRARGYTKGRVLENRVESACSVLVKFVESIDDTDAFWCNEDDLIECADPYVVDRNSKFDEWQQTEQRMKQRRDEMLSQVFGHEVKKEEPKPEVNSWDLTKWITFFQTSYDDTIYKTLRGRFGYTKDSLITPFGEVLDGQLLSELDPRFQWLTRYVARCEKLPWFLTLFDD